MPEMDGLGAATEIRRREADSDQRAPIVALTASAIEGDREQCLAAGMDDYLPKPFTAEQIKSALASWLSLPQPADARAQSPWIELLLVPNSCLNFNKVEAIKSGITILVPHPAYRTDGTSIANQHRYSGRIGLTPSQTPTATHSGNRCRGQRGRRRDGLSVQKTAAPGARRNGRSLVLLERR